MCATTEDRVNRALNSILDKDADLAKTVRHGDREVDVMELEIEDECLRILALHTPVAGDLRHVLAVLGISREFERMADLAKGIAKRVLEITRRPSPDWPPELREMIEATRKMLEEANHALAEGDIELAHRVRASDAFVDRQNKRLIRWAIEYMRANPDAAETVVAFLSVLRAVERIADQCTNVAEEIIMHQRRGRDHLRGGRPRGAAHAREDAGERIVDGPLASRLIGGGGLPAD